MPEQDAGELVVAANGDVFVADAATSEPVLSDDDAALALDGWDKLGLITPDGVRPSYSRTTTDIGAWQLPGAARKLITGRNLDIAFDLMQWNAVTLPFAFGGGVVEDDSGEFVFTEPDPESLDERALLVRWADEDENFQLWVPRGVVSGNSEFTLARTDNADLPTTWSATPASNDELWKLRSDSSGMDPAAS